MNDDRFKDPKFIKWSYEVKSRDDFTCKICKKRGGRVVAHHKNSWDMFPNERYEMNNGVTLCWEHHENFHQIYNFGNNTAFQFEEYCKFLSLIKNLAEKNNGKI